MNKEEQEKTKLLDRVEVDFTYQAATQTAVSRMQVIREKAKELAIMMIENGVPGRELSDALTHLETSVNRVNAGIVRDSRFHQ